MSKSPILLLTNDPSGLFLAVGEFLGSPSIISSIQIPSLLIIRKNRHEQSAGSDSLFIDIYKPSSKFYLTNNKELAGIEVIYWRDVSRRDRVATLRMNMDSEKKYIVFVVCMNGQMWTKSDKNRTQFFRIDFALLE